MLTDRHIMRDEEIRISCNLSFTDRNSRPSPFFDYLLFNGNTDVQMRILRTYWTSQGNVVPGNNTSNTSSYVLIKAPKHGFIPPHRCNIVCDFYSTRYNHTIVNSSMELSFSTDQIEVLCKYILSILSVTWQKTFNHVERWNRMHTIQRQQAMLLHRQTCKIY